MRCVIRTLPSVRTTAVRFLADRDRFISASSCRQLLRDGRRSLAACRQNAIITISLQALHSSLPPSLALIIITCHAAPRGVDSRNIFSAGASFAQQHMHCAMFGNYCDFDFWAQSRRLSSRLAGRYSSV